jgi:hypothetical protein
MEMMQAEVCGRRCQSERDTHLMAVQGGLGEGRGLYQTEAHWEE